MATAVQPDVELAVVNYLRGFASLTAASPTGLGAKVGTELPATPTWPFVVLTLQDDGITAHGWLSHPRFQIDSWADTKKKARDAAFVTVAAIFDITGTRDGAVISVPEDVILSGPRWLPDDTIKPARPRYITDVRLAAHPTP